MTPNAKLLIGGLATTALAAGFHWPLNAGQTYINHLDASAAEALSSGPAGVTAKFQQTPLQRVAVLSGPVTDPAERLKLLAEIKALPGVHDAVWTTQAPPVAAAPPPEKPATVEAVKNCQADVDGVIKGKTIEFASGAATLTDNGQALVDALAAKLGPCAGTKVEIDGHTDATGDAGANQTLSEARATSVAKALTAKGVPNARLVTKGFGSTKPVADGATAEAYAKNRRIEFTVSSAS